MVSDWFNGVGNGPVSEFISFSDFLMGEFIVWRDLKYWGCQIHLEINCINASLSHRVKWMNRIDLDRLPTKLFVLTITVLWVWMQIMRLDRSVLFNISVKMMMHPICIDWSLAVTWNCDTFTHRTVSANVELYKTNGPFCWCNKRLFVVCWINKTPFQYRFVSIQYFFILSWLWLCVCVWKHKR